MSAPIQIERESGPTRIPLDWRMQKLFIEASVDGRRSGTFLFDTGSPTILSRRFADTLELEVLGQNTGVDANGNAVTMDVARVETLALGDTVFHGVPVLVFDFGSLEMGTCFMRDGVIGSEILPGSAWRIDVEQGELTLAEDGEALGTRETAVSAPLHDFGYPHMPIVDYALGDVTDRALFDTGSAEEVALFRPVAESGPVRALMVDGSRMTGQGSEGVSAGGRGEVQALSRFDLTGFEIGGTRLGEVTATTRSVPPSLIGAGMLNRYHVVLDYPGGEFRLEPREAPEAPRAHAGFAVGYEEGAGRVLQLFTPSPAQAAGLQLHDRVIEINGRLLDGADAEQRCDQALWLAQSFSGAEGGEFVILRDGERLTLTIPPVEG
ncbi:aspartyl protease family protein [Marinicauda sp. Alg238-R41]|uniref:aspartyl protease family protein n=1 Tax=Marinicauda sp. Alg238-R41 TaxID=2993447 RepID=UPI0022E56B56|nr:aspartyl protease family protein [Marinicauda sp. Alg238-R41]